MGGEGSRVKAAITASTLCHVCSECGRTPAREQKILWKRQLVISSLLTSYRTRQRCERQRCSEEVLRRTAESTSPYDERTPHFGRLARSSCINRMSASPAGTQRYAGHTRPWPRPMLTHSCRAWAQRADRRKSLLLRCPQPVVCNYRMKEFHSFISFESCKLHGQCVSVDMAGLQTF